MPIAINGIANPAPYAPTLLQPANATYQDLATTPTFSWTYNPGTTGNTQTAWALRRKISGATTYQWWNISTSAWQSTQIFNTGSAQSYTFPSGAWADGYTYNWSMANQDQSGIGAYSADNTVTAQAGPTVSVTSPSGLITTGQPTISWTAAFPTSAQQTSYRVLIYNSTQYLASGFAPGSSTALFDTGVVAASTTFSVSLLGSSTYLADNVSYRAYVQITETGGQTSNWIYAAFSTSYTQPATPVLSAYLTTDSNTGAPLATISVTGQDPSGSSFLGQTSALVQYSDDGGVTWSAVRGGSSISLPASNQQGSLTDYEMTPGTPRTYRAYVVDAATGVVSLASPSVSITSEVTTWWIIPPLDPSLAVELNVVTFQMTQMEQATPHTVLGQPYAIVVGSVMGGKDGSITVQTTSSAAWDTLQATLNAQQTLWMINPLGDGLYVRFGPQPGGMGSGGYGVTSKQSQVLASASNYRQITLTYIEQAKP
jgi:hypothetical protein